MPKTLVCPKCKTAIVIDQAAMSAGNVDCGGCGASFRIGKRSSETAAPPAAPVSSRAVAKPVQPSAEEGFAEDGLGIDLGGMNFDNMAASTDQDPLGVADPFAATPSGDPWGGIAAPTASASMYSAPTMTKPAPAKKAPSRTAMILMVVGGVLGALLLCCGLVGFFFIRKVMNSNEDQNRMRLVALGMLNYESMYKRLPVPVVKDGTGKPVYSWTVTVLPYVDAPFEFNNFDQNKLLPWDAAGNEVLRGPSPTAFRSARAGSKSDHRNVFVLSTPNISDRMAPVFKDGLWVRISSISDGTQKTILALQFTRYSRPWAEPGDLDIEQALQLIQKEPSPVLAVLCDGSLLWIPNNIDAARFQAMATAAADDQW